MVLHGSGFSLTRGEGRLAFDAVPANQEVDLTYTIDGGVVLALGLRRVSGLRIYRRGEDLTESEGSHAYQ